MTYVIDQPPTTSLPAPLDDHVFETIAHWFDLLISQIQAADSHRILPAFIRKLVREGKMTLRRVIELTSNRDAAIDADTALRDMAEEINERGEELPKLLTTDAVRKADTVITMGCGDACPVFPGKRYEDWELEDPAGKDLAAVRRIRDEIERRVRALVEELASGE